MKKLPGFLTRLRIKYLVTIDEKYWTLQYPNWNVLHVDEQREIKHTIYSKMDSSLNVTGKKAVTIFCPMVSGNSTVDVKKMSGKKRPRIIYKNSIV